MAFEVPLDADRVDDLNLFSTFVRAPVVGTLMWMLGGDKARAKEEEEREHRNKVLLAGSDDSESCVAASQSVLRTSNSIRKGLATKSVLKKAAPSLIGSEISDVGECSEALEGMHLVESSQNDPFKRPKKELSWSDESGHSLVEFIGESDQAGSSSSVPVSDSHTTRSTSSSLTRSPSVRASSLAKSPDDNRRLHTPRYLPRGLEDAHNGINIPRMPNSVEHTNTGSATDGVESPQWGWFMRTTPPTPQMYHSTPPGGKSSRTRSSSGPPSSSLRSAQPNPVFQGLQDKHKAAPVGWSSVPL